jgi:hypothetical protein
LFPNRNSKQMMSSYATFHEDSSPIYLIRFTGEKPTEKSFQEFLGFLDGILDQKELYTVIFDAIKVPPLSFSFQKKMADWMAFNKEQMKSYCKGTAYIIQNALIRAALKGIFFIQPQPVPYKIFDTEKKALEWVKEQLGKI